MRTFKTTVFALIALAASGGCDDGPVFATGAGDMGGVLADGAADGAASPSDAAPERPADAAPRMDAVRGDAGSPADGAAPGDGAAPVDGAAAPDGAAAADGAPASDGAVAADAGRADGAAPPDAAVPDDAGPPPPADLCAPCGDAAECAALGEGAACTPLLGGSACTSACDPDGGCPRGYFCVLGQCVPAGARCDGCATTGCPDGQRCNVDGFCVDRAARCGTCQADEECQDGLFCRQVGLGRSCVATCANGEACAPGFTCDAGACMPDAGFCDLCGGCGGDRPVCNVITRECIECGIGSPCPDGRVCDMAGSCVEPPMGVQCNTGLDCRAEDRPFCVESSCVQCRDQADCAPGTSCADGACEEAPCGGFGCQAGSECDPQAGQCRDVDGAPGCAADADCGDPEAMRCNAATGQCYQADQRCDPNGETSVCAPGGLCRPALGDPQHGDCTCARTDPNNFDEPNDQHRVPCQPGGVCWQLGGDPGICRPAR